MSTSWTLDQLRTFLLVLETGSFSTAAERLGVSQPAVSLQLRQLERHLGLRLVERVGRRMTPTQAGTELLHHGPGVLAAARAATEAVQSHAQGVSGTVRLGTGATACLHFLPPILRALKQDYPALQVVVSTGNTEDYLQALERNTIDMALVTLPAKRRNLHVQAVLEDPFVAIAPTDSPALRKWVRPEDLRELPLVLFEPAANTRVLIDAWFTATGRKPSPFMELGSVEAIKEMVAAGLGVSLVPKMAIRTSDYDALQVAALRPALTRTLGLVTRQDKPVTRGMAALSAALMADRRSTRKSRVQP